MTIRYSSGCWQGGVVEDNYSVNLSGPSSAMSVRTAISGLSNTHGDDVGDLPVFLVSLCDGIGGALLACTQRASNIEAHVVESAPAFLNLVSLHVSRVTTEADVLTMDVDSLLSRTDSADWELLLLIGGPPVSRFRILDLTKGF